MSRDSSTHTHQTSHTEIQMAVVPRPIPSQNNETNIIQQEMKIGLWFFQAYHSFKFSVSTLYLSISILDRLRRLNFKFQQGKKKLLTATITLLTSKFNEVRQLQIKNINRLQGSEFTLSEYREMEGMILEALSFQVADEGNVYYRLHALHYKYECPERVQLFCKMHLQDEEVRRYGSKAFIDAVGLIFSSQRILKDQIKDSVKEVKRLLLEYQEKNTKTS